MLRRALRQPGKPAPSPAVHRRALLQGALAALFLPLAEGCGPSAGPAVPRAEPLLPLQTTPLSALVAAAGVRWVVFASPRALLGVPWLPPLVDLAVSGARFDRFAQTTGIDLRTLPEAIVLSCAPAERPNRTPPLAGSALPSAPPAGSPPSASSAKAAPGNSPLPNADVPAGSAAPAAPEDKAKAADDDVTFYLARHVGDGQSIERTFRARLSGGEKRAVDRPDVVRISGKIGRETHAAVFLGPDVAGFQEGGSVSRGPARVASLFAEGKLKHAHSVLASEPLGPLATRLGAAPLSALSPGPFEGEVAKGLRGLLGAATAIGATARPGQRESFLVTAVVTGDFTTSGGPAAEELLAAWKDLAGSRLGHSLGLDRPLSQPVVSSAPDAVMLAVELSARAVAEGLAQLTATRVQDIFR